MSKSNEVVPWQERMAAEAKAVATSERPTTNKISLRSGILSIDDNPLAGNEMTCVIVGALHEQVKYDEAWDPNKVIPPVCFGFNEAPAAKGAMQPHEDVPTPVSENCVDCWARQFGENGEKPECQGRRRIAVSAWNSDGTLDNDIFTMSFPQYSSGKQFSAYANEVSLREQRPPWGVITRLFVEPHPRWQFLVKYEIAGLVPDEVMADVYAKVDAATAALSMPYDMAPPDSGEAPAVKGTK